MAATRSASSRRRGSPAPHGIRWDRLGRIALLCVFALVAYLYIGPAANWVSTWRESKQRAARLEELRTEHARLKARRDALRRADTLEVEARRLGMLRPGEKAFVISGLPRG
jgi:cell division protein FtsB